MHSMPHFVYSHKDSLRTQIISTRFILDNISYEYKRSSCECVTICKGRFITLKCKKRQKLFKLNAFKCQIFHSKVESFV